MGYALLINIGIMLIVAFGISLDQNPLYVLALMFMRDLPYGLHPNAKQEEEPDAPNSMGFIDQ